VTITRFPYEGLGRCEAVVSDGLVYAVATDPHCADGILAQTRNALDELSSIFEKAGSGRPGLLQVTVFLSDVKQKEEMDTIWIDWIGPKENWPQRACVDVDLYDGCLIEIVVTAKLLRSAPQYLSLNRRAESVKSSSSIAFASPAMNDMAILLYGWFYEANTIGFRSS